MLKYKVSDLENKKGEVEVEVIGQRESELFQKDPCVGEDRHCLKYLPT